MSEKNLVNSVKSEVDDRVDSLGDAAKAAVSSVANTPGEITQMAANVLIDGGDVAGKTGEDAVDFLVGKVKDITAIIAKLGGTVTGN